MCSLLGIATRISILCSLFLIYLKSDHIYSTHCQIVSSWCILLSLLYARTLAGKLNSDLKANLNGHLSMCYLIQIWVRLKKLYLHGKWQNNFTRKSVSTFTICRNFIWMINWIYITIFCKEQTNNKVTLTFSHYTNPNLEYGC